MDYKKLTKYVCGNNGGMAFLFWTIFILISFIFLGGVIVMFIPKVTRSMGDRVPFFAVMLIAFGALSGVYLKFIINMHTHKEALTIKFNNLFPMFREEVISNAYNYLQSGQGNSMFITYPGFFIGRYFVYGKLARCKGPRSLVLNPLVYEYIPLGDIVNVTSGDYMGKYMCMIYTTEGVWYRAASTPQQVLYLRNILLNNNNSFNNFTC